MEEGGGNISCSGRTSTNFHELLLRFGRMGATEELQVGSTHIVFPSLPPVSPPASPVLSPETLPLGVMDVPPDAALISNTNMSCWGSERTELPQSGIRCGPGFGRGRRTWDLRGPGPS